MKTLIPLLSFLIAVAQADESVKSLTIGGKTFENCTVSKFDDRTAWIRHSKGNMHVPLSDLPTDLRAKLDPKSPAPAPAPTAPKAMPASDKIGQIAAAGWVKVRVLENRADGLVADLYHTDVQTRPVITGGAVTGSTSETRFVRTNKPVWITHTPETMKLANESDFYAKVSEYGSIRLDEKHVRTAYRLTEFKANLP